MCLESSMVGSLSEYATPKGHKTVAEQTRWFKRLPSVLMMQQNVRNPNTLKNVLVLIIICSESNLTKILGTIANSRLLSGLTRKSQWIDTSLRTESERHIQEKLLISGEPSLETDKSKLMPLGVIR